MPSFARLTVSASGKSDGSGNITISFGSVPTGLVWRGSVFVDGSPATTSWRVTVSGVPWGTMLGGTALLVEALGGDTIQITSSTATVSTTFVAWLNGSSVDEQVPAEVGYFNPFPGTTR